MSNFAAADTATQWFAGRFAGSRINPNNGVLHTTETTSWPSYDGGATAPHYTGRPDFTRKVIVWRAHFPDEMSARALRNESGGVETNTMNAIQVELIGTCDPETHQRWKGVGFPHMFWPQAPAWALQAVALLVADLHRRHGIQIEGPGKPWLPYPSSFGSAGGQRMSFAQWREHLGWAGHQHVPENAHGDPGDLDWVAIEQAAKQLVAPRETPVADRVARAAIRRARRTEGKPGGRVWARVAALARRLSSRY